MSRQWAATTALALTLAVAGVQAQAQTVIGGGKKPDVEVDFGVLGRIGPEPTLPNVLNPRVPPAPAAPANRASAAQDTGVITLKPPASPRKAQTAKTEPRKTPDKTAADKKAADKKALTALKTRSDAVQDAKRAETTPPPPAKPVKAAQTVSSRPPPRPPVAPERKPAIEVTEPDATPTPVKTAMPVETVAAAPQPLAPQLPPPQIAAAPAPAAGPPVIEMPSLPVKAPELAPPPVAPPAVQETAAVTPPAAPPPQGQVISKADAISVVFTQGGATLPDMAKQELQRLSQRLDRDQALQLQLLAYAEGDDASASKARRLSLSRALAVRSYLMDQGVRSTRIEVRALGNKSGDGPGDRVDISLTQR